MTVTEPSRAPIARLSPPTASRQRELDAIRFVAEARSMIDMASGMLMEQLGCSPAEARRQLAHLATESGSSVTELAAQITRQPVPEGAADDGFGQGGAAHAGAAAAAGADAVAAALLGDALASAGAVAITLWLTEPDGGVDLAGQAGFGRRDGGRRRRIHPEIRTLAQQAAQGTDIWWPAGPPGGEDRPLMSRWRGGARAALPLRAARGTLGAMVVCWPRPVPDFDAPLRRQLAALAELAARELRPAPAADADEAERLAALLQHAQRLGRIGGWEENLLTGELHWTESTFALFGQQPDAPVPLAELDSRVPADDIQVLESFRDSLLRERMQSAAAFRIVRASDGSVRQIRAYAEPVTDAAGMVVAVRGAYQDVSADYHTRLAFAAAAEELADTQQRAAEEHRVAMRLQQAITPRSGDPVEVAGLEVAARYRPAGPASLVSGDWYDTVLLPGKDVLLVVGDIAGHGLDAVTGMVAVRNGLRGLAITGAGPATLLGWLNTAACHYSDGVIGTAVCGLYDPVRRSLRWARAGHLPPILVRDGRASTLALPPGILLGADPDASYTEVTTRLGIGDTLLLFTDGLIERRDEPIDEAIHKLLQIAGKPISDIGRYADYVAAEAASDTGDDACLVAVRVR